MTSQTWRKSSYSTNQGGNCVETTGFDDAAVGVRDSKDVGVGHLTVTPAAWSALLESLRA